MRCVTLAARDNCAIFVSRTSDRSTTAPRALVDKMRKNGFTKGTRRTVALGYECPDLCRRPLHFPIARRRYCRYTCLPSDSFSLTLLSPTTCRAAFQALTLVPSGAPKAVQRRWVTV